MKQHYGSVGLERLSRLFGKTRQAFYDHSWRTIDEQFNEAMIIDKVRSIRERIPGIGGVPLHKMLKQEMLLHWGIQYCCAPYVDILQKNNIRISMTQSGSPYDNAVDAYNCLRPHRSLNDLTPDKAHITRNLSIKKWKSKKYPRKARGSKK